MPEPAWLDRRHYLDLDPGAERALRAAGLSWHDEPEAESHLARARSLAPSHIAVAVAHYRYHLYKHRFAEAELHARTCLSLASAALGLPGDHTKVDHASLDFAAPDPRVRFWLFALQALGYVILRCGRRDEGMQALRKVVELDVADQTRSRALVDVIDRARPDGDP